MTFQILPLPKQAFEPYFQMSDAALAGHRARRVTADSYPGFPCRVSLEDAQPGETLLLINYTHHDRETPYRASHAVFVREAAVEAALAPGEVPEVIRRRLISARVFDAGGDLIGSEVMPGTEAGAWLAEAFKDPRAAEVHLHHARHGCFAAKAVRA